MKKTKFYQVALSTRLGSISYKDTNTNETSQQTQSIDTTATIVTETFQSEEKILPNESPEKQYEFATSL